MIIEDLQPPKFLEYTDEQPIINPFQEDSWTQYLEGFETQSKKLPEISHSEIQQPRIQWSKKQTKKHSFKSKQDFVDTFKPIIERELSNKGISLQYTDSLLAQIALESSWGKSESGKNNYAGLKSSKGTAVKTKEYINGKYVSTVDTFKDFNSIEDFVKYYIDRLDKRFKAFSGGDFVANIKNRGYFTAPFNDYKKLHNLIKHNISKLA